jgi:hypothetical protein
MGNAWRWWRAQVLTETVNCREASTMVNYSAVFLAALAAVSGVAATDYPTPGATYEASAYTAWEEKTVANSKKAKIYVPFTAADGSEDMVSIYRLDLVGNDYERGYAHGYLMAKGKLLQ